MKLTAKNIKSLPLRERAYSIADDAERGLELRVMP